MADKDDQGKEEKASRQWADTLPPDASPHTGGVRPFQGFQPSIYVSTSTAAATTNERDAILALGHIFQELPDPLLSAYADDDVPLGPRLDNPPVAETTLKALAAHERERRKTDTEMKKWKIAVVVAPLAALILGALLRNWLL